MQDLHSFLFAGGVGFAMLSGMHGWAQLKNGFAAIVYMVAVGVFLGLSQLFAQGCAHHHEAQERPCSHAEALCFHDGDGDCQHEAFQLVPSMAQTQAIQKIIEAGLLPLLIATARYLPMRPTLQSLPIHVRAMAPPWEGQAFIRYAPRLYPRT